MLGLGNSLIGGIALEDVFNKFSIDLDGNSDYINLGNADSIKPTATDTSLGVGLSVAIWCKADDWNVTTVGPLLNCIQSGGWKLDWSNRMIFSIANAAGTAAPQSAYKPFEGVSDAHYRASGWHLIAATFDGRYAKLYIDGTLEATVDEGSDDNAISYGTGNNNVDVLIGADPGPLTGGVSGTSTGTAFFPGLIDEVAIWNKILDLDAVKEMFDAVDVDGVPLDLTGDTGDYDYSSDLVGYWRMEEGAGSTVADSSSNSSTGALKGTAAFVETIPS